MDILLLLVPMSVVLVLAIAVVFAWSVRSGQFDDLESPAWRILADDDSVPAPAADPCAPAAAPEGRARPEAARLTSIKAPPPARP